MKAIRSLGIMALYASVCVAAAAGGADRDTVYQAAPIQSLSVGVYDGFITFADLKKHGATGLGTFNALDGEMVGVDGVFYQVKNDGTVLKAQDSALTPFAVVTFFDEDLVLEAEGISGLADLTAKIDARLPSKNLFYAVRVDGLFDYVKVRSVPAQEKPYVKLAEAVGRQSVFERSKIRGTVIGFRSPEFAEKINVPGYHFHFISAERDFGGHLLDLRSGALKVRVDSSAALTLIMPESGSYISAELGGDEHRDLKKIE